MRYVYPNVSEDNRCRRGSLSARLVHAGQLGCELVEVPADLIRNKTEARLTGLGLGAILDERSVACLYSDGDAGAAGGEYLMHTEPLLPRTGLDGVAHPPRPSWADRKWVNHFAEMLLVIAKHLGSAPVVVEIQPGDRSNSFADIIVGASAIRERLEKGIGFAPLVWLENRAGQAVQTGSELAAFWQTAKALPRVSPWLGIGLDVHQLWTATRASFSAELEAVPDEAVRALHIHHRHRMPTPQDPIPWPLVFSRQFTLSRGFAIKPDVHHRSEVEGTIQFCEQQLSAQRAAEETAV